MEDLLAELLLTLVDVCIELISVLTDGELLVVINGNVDLLGAHWFILGVVELAHIRVAECLFCCETFQGVEVKQAFQEV